MKKILTNMLGTMVISIVFTCMTSLVVVDALSLVINEKNITKLIKEINITDVLMSNSEQYETLLGQTSTGSNVLDANNSNLTSFSQEELNKIIGSEEYANILGDYIVEEDLLNNLNSLDNIDLEKAMESISQDDIRKALNDMDVDYNEKDIEYITNTIPSVAPTIVNGMGSNMNVNLGKFDISGIKKIFSKDAKVVIWVALIISVIALVFLYREKNYYAIILAIETGIMCIMTRIFYNVLTSGTKEIPEEYNSVLSIFVKPLKESLYSYHITFLVITIVCVIIFAILNYVITKTSIGSSINDLHLANEINDDLLSDSAIDEMLNIANSNNDFSNIDVEVKDINKEIDEFFM